MLVVTLCYYILENKRRLMKFALYIFVWLMVFNIRGREFGMSSKFKLKNFAIQPSVEQLTFVIRMIYFQLLIYIKLKLFVVQ